MNLLSILLKVMTAKSALHQVSKKTGLSEKQIKMLMTIAIPILLKYMTRNASSSEGANSLLGALTQHTDKKEMDQQLKEADEKDGGKIIGHILGKKKPEVTQQLSAQSGLSQDQVSQILAIMAPAIMSGVSAAAAAEPQQPVSSAGSVPGIFSALLGSAASSHKEEEEKNESINGTALLQALLNARK